MLRTKVAGIDFENCLYNASGPRTASVDALTKIAGSESGAVLAKSATLIKQDGNTLPRFINKINMGDYCQGSMNSEGLPNAGIDYYVSRDATQIISSFNKPYIVSLSGLSLADNLKMLDKVYDATDISAIELNLACPNIPNKPIIAYDMEQMEDVLKAVVAHPQHGKIPLGVKLAPYFDRASIQRVVDIIVKYPIQYIVCVNTIGNALFVDAENECVAIAANQGHGGLGGGFIKHTALANVRMLSQLLTTAGRGVGGDNEIDIIGVGGVHTGKDAFELILCGASAVQIGTCHWTEGSACFGRISKELQQIMLDKGYTSIADFRGKLKPYSKPSSSSGSISKLSGNSTSTTSTMQPIFYGIIGFLLAVIVLLLVSLTKQCNHSDSQYQQHHHQQQL